MPVAPGFLHNLFWRCDIEAFQCLEKFGTTMELVQNEKIKKQTKLKQTKKTQTKTKPQNQN